MIDLLWWMTRSGDQSYYSVAGADPGFRKGECTRVVDIWSMVSGGCAPQEAKAISSSGLKF